MTGKSLLFEVSQSRLSVFQGPKSNCPFQRQGSERCSSSSAATIDSLYRMSSIPFRSKPSRLSNYRSYRDLYSTSQYIWFHSISYVDDWDAALGQATCGGPCWTQATACLKVYKWRKCTRAGNNQFRNTYENMGSERLCFCVVFWNYSRVMQQCNNCRARYLVQHITQT